MYVFSHLHKAAGTSVNHALRRTFGLRHLDAISGEGHLYTEKDLQYDQTKFVKPLSIAGHCLRPHIDYGIFEEGMEWYTIIRDPVSRCISHYQHQVQKMNNKLSFLEWIRSDLYRNWMVYFYGGSNSLQQAIDAVHQKNMRVFDLAAGLETGMQLLFSDKLKWKEAVKNPAMGNMISQDIRSSEDLMSEVLAANELDLALFRHMKLLENTALPEMSVSRFSLPAINRLLSLVYRNLIYRRNKS